MIDADFFHDSSALQVVGGGVLIAGCRLDFRKYLTHVEYSHTQRGRVWNHHVVPSCAHLSQKSAWLSSDRDVNKRSLLTKAMMKEIHDYDFLILWQRR